MGAGAAAGGALVGAAHRGDTARHTLSNNTPLRRIGLFREGLVDFIGVGAGV